jgi:hypothetical protein
MKHPGPASGGVDGAEEGRGVVEVGKHHGGLVCAELFDGKISRGNGDGFCADDFAAFDVPGCIADDKNVLGRKFDAVAFARAAQGMGAKVVAPRAVVGEGAEFKVMPDGEVFELDPGAAQEVAGEQALGEVGAAMERLEQRENAGVQAGTGVRHFGGERVQIAFEVTPDVFRRLWQAIVAQNFVRDPGVSAAGIFKPVKRAVEAEPGFERGNERAFARATGSDEGAIYIPKDELLHEGRENCAQRPAWSKRVSCAGC